MLKLIWFAPSSHWPILCTANMYYLLFRFWLAVQDLKCRPLQEVAARAQEIWQEFLAEGAPNAINLDSHSYERTSQNLKDPGRYSFEDAQVSNCHRHSSTTFVPFNNFHTLSAHLEKMILLYEPNRKKSWDI